MSNLSFPEWQHKFEVSGNGLHGMGGTITAGLHWLRGNSRPYFSVTGHFGGNGPGSYAGCCHDEIAKLVPMLVSVIALHLSTDKGVPMHALANARYHAGLCKGMADGRNIPYLASHLRCSEMEAENLADAGEEALCAYVAAQGPRWEFEAKQAIATLEFLKQTRFSI